MNTFDAYGVSVSFNTNATNCDAAFNELFHLLEKVGVEITTSCCEVVLSNSGGEEIESFVNFD